MFFFFFFFGLFCFARGVTNLSQSLVFIAALLSWVHEHTLCSPFQRLVNVSVDIHCGSRDVNVNFSCPWLNRKRFALPWGVRRFIRPYVSWWTKCLAQTSTQLQDVPVCHLWNLLLSVLIFFPSYFEFQGIMGSTHISLFSLELKLLLLFLNEFWQGAWDIPRNHNAWSARSKSSALNARSPLRGMKTSRETANACPSPFSIYTFGHSLPYSLDLCASGQLKMLQCANGLIVSADITSTVSTITNA